MSGCPGRTIETGMSVGPRLVAVAACDLVVLGEAELALGELFFLARLAALVALERAVALRAVVALGVAGHRGCCGDGEEGRYGA